MIEMIITKSWGSYCEKNIEMGTSENNVTTIINKTIMNGPAMILAS